MTNKELNEKVEFNTEKIFEHRKRITELEKCFDELRISFNEFQEKKKIWEKECENFRKINSIVNKFESKIDKLESKINACNEQKLHHKFQVGDRVQFKSWEEINKTNKWCISAYQLQKLAGTQATIREIEKGGDELFIKLSNFSIKDDVEFYQTLYYNPEWFKPATDEPKCKFKVGDKVKGVKRSKPIYARRGEVTQIFNNGIYDVLFEDDFCPISVYEHEIEPYTEPRWTFTDDEKVILRNVPEKYKWIARDKNNRLSIHFEKPIRYKNSWNAGGLLIDEFNHLFKSIKWEDEEPCEFRKYL